MNALLSRENVKKNLSNYFAEHKLQVVFRTDDRELWAKTCNQLPFFPVAYADARIDYQMLYYQFGSGFDRDDIDMMDLSVVLLSNNKICGVWPLTISQQQSNSGVSSYGSPVLPPLFVENTGVRLIRRMTRSCSRILHNYFANNTTMKVLQCESGYSDSGFNEWHKYFMEQKAVVRLQHEMYVDLSLDADMIRANLRKSFKPLITMAEKQWKVRVFQNNSIDLNRTVWDAYRELHYQVSERTTRALETWDIQFQHIKTGNAIFISLQDKSENLIGGGLFTLSRDEACYSVGVYDRNLFDKPLGHIVQWKAIEEFKKKGLRWYNIGRRFYSTDVPKPTEKELSISFFKEGFATNLIPKFMLELHKV